MLSASQEILRGSQDLWGMQDYERSPKGGGASAFMGAALESKAVNSGRCLGEHDMMGL